MRLRTDDRGVTVQIGTVLLFAVVVVLLSTYQATVVPQQNEQVEFDHNQRVQGQLQDLRDELRRTAVVGSGGSASVALGTRYPTRAFFVNPPPPSGTLATTPARNATLRNARATGETGDYWNGSARRFSTRGLVYDPLYHVYDDAPTTVYRNGVLYDRFESADRNRTIAGQQLVRGNRITLVAVNGSLSKSGTASASVDLQAVSPATRTVAVENESADENVTLVLPTNLRAATWQDLLGDELDRTGTNPDAHVSAVEDVTGRDAVRVVLEPGVYELRLAKVGVGRDVSGVGPHYVTDVRGDETSVAEGATRKLVVEVRDRFNNPVAGARVNFSLVGDESNDTLVHRGASNDAFRNLLTDSNGRVAVQFEAGEVGGSVREADVRASIEAVPDGGFDPETKENATFDLQVYGAGGGGGGDGDDGGNGSDETPTADIAWRVIDNTLNNNADYQVEYDVSGDATSVNVTYEDETESWGSSNPPSNDDLRDTIPHSRNGAGGHTYNVTIRAYDADGTLLAERSLTDVADGTNPDGGDTIADLREPDSPLLSSVAVTDRTPQYSGATFDVTYETTHGNATSPTVRFEFRNLNASWATRTRTSNGRQGTATYSEDGTNGDTYDIVATVVDDDGIVVNETVVREVADGQTDGNSD